MPFGRGLVKDTAALIRGQRPLRLDLWLLFQLRQILQIDKSGFRGLGLMPGPEIQEGKTGGMEQQRERQQVQKPLLDILV